MRRKIEIIFMLKMYIPMIFASALSLSSPRAHAASSIPNDCWFGVLTPDKALHGALVATGPVAQWRVGMSLVLYSTKEDDAQITALTEKGQTATFDISHPLTVIPTWISGPEPGDKSSGEDQSIELTMTYRNARGEFGNILLTYWTPMSNKQKELSADQQEFFTQMDQQLHDTNCRNIP